MAEVRMEIVEPYQRKGEDVIVKINKTIIEAGLPPKTEYLSLQLKGHAKVSDEQIGKLAMSAIKKHLEMIPGDI
jgi:hypothetical protein